MVATTGTKHQHSGTAKAYSLQNMRNQTLAQESMWPSRVWAAGVVAFCPMRLHKQAVHPKGHRVLPVSSHEALLLPSPNQVFTEISG